jgi:hypothetical protein
VHHSHWRGKWNDEMLEEAMDTIENGRTSLRQVNRHWNKHYTYLSSRLNDKTRSKKRGQQNVFIEKEDEVAA